MDGEVCLFVPGETLEPYLHHAFSAMLDKATGYALRTERGYLADMNAG
jgi:hypothetical protein